MGFCKEFYDWSNTTGSYDFEIKEVSSGMLPGDKRLKFCNGIGFVSMYKDIDGTLMLEMRINENETQLRKFIEIKSEFLDSRQF